MRTLKKRKKNKMDDYKWRTEYYHGNNSTTMDDYLEEHVDDDYEIMMVDGSYAEIKIDGVVYEAHASGDGDSFNHKIEFKEKEKAKC